MKDGSGSREPAGASRQALRRDYVNWYAQQCAEVRPCCDPQLMGKAARYLRQEAEVRAAFTAFPFYEVLTEGRAALSVDCRKHLSALIKATEVLETLCFNLFLQPWRKEIRTVKTYTGPFVYCLLPVLSTSTIQSVLASIGYLPHGDAGQGEFRLRRDPDADTAMLVGFELLLARVECHSLLELQQKLGSHELLEVLHRRVQPTNQMKPSEQKAAKGQMEEDESEKVKKKEVLDKKEVWQGGGATLKQELQYLNSKLAASPRPKPRHCHLVSPDTSLLEMQETYPDLAFRGRPLLPDKPQRAPGSLSTGRPVQTAEALRTGSAESFKAAAAAALNGNDESRAAEVSVNSGRNSDCDDRTSQELSGPQAISLHLTLRAGPREEETLQPEDPHPTPEPPPYAQLQSDRQKLRESQQEFASMTSLDEEQELRKLSERMGTLSVHEGMDEQRRKESKGGEAEESSGRVQGAGTGEVPACKEGKRFQASQSEQKGTREQRQPSVVERATNRHRKRGRRGQQEENPGVRQTGEGEEENDFVLL